MFALAQSARASDSRSTKTAVVGSWSPRKSGARPIDAQEVGGLLLAIEDGYLLHRLIDPESTPADAYLDAIRRLQELVLEP